MSAAGSDLRSGPWTGRSGRVYVLDEGDSREGGMASILRVRPVGVAVDTSFSEPGTLLALKLARADEPMSVDALNREAEVFQTLRSAQGMPPCPRLHDLVSLPDSERVVGLVMEWCPLDMERWWADVYQRPWAFAELCEALAEVCLRLREYQATCAAATSQRVAHSDVKPRNLLRAQDARWLLTDFGASKARDLDGGDWSATRVILGTESFIAPEGLFNARKSHPEAMDIWSVGATLYALLRMRAYLQAGNKMPLNGTHSTHFRSHRVALVSDLHQRKPALFIDKPLDPTQFASPTRLPDKDRVAIAECLRGCFATADHEAAVVEATLSVLDRAMQIDPQARYADAAEMALALADLARLGRVDANMDATRVSLLTADGLEEAAPDVTGVRPLGAPPPGSDGRAPNVARKPTLGVRTAVRPLSGQVQEIVELPPKSETLPPPVDPTRTAETAEKPEKRVLVGGNVRPQTIPRTAEAPPATSAPLPDAAPVAAEKAVLSSRPLPPAAPPIPKDARTESPRMSRRIPARVPGWLSVTLPVLVILQLVVIGLQITQLLVNARRDAAPVPVAAPAPTPAAPKTGLVMVSGALAYLDRIGTTVPIGLVPVGRYTLYALPDGATEFIDLGTVQVAADERIVYRCSQEGCARL